MGKIASILFVVLLSSGAWGKPRVKWSTEQGGRKGLGEIDNCLVYFSEKHSSTLADATLLMTTWYQADRSWCVGDGMTVVLMRTTVDRVPYAIIPAALGDYIMNDTALQERLRTVAYALATAFKKNFYFLVTDPDSRVQDHRYALKIMGEYVY